MKQKQTKISEDIIMKTTILTFVFVAFALITFATSPESNSSSTYVITKNGVQVCKDFKIGLFKTKIQMTDGQTVMVSNSDITGYYKNNRLFEYLPLYINHVKVENHVKMELIRVKNNQKVYKHEVYNASNKVQSILNVYDKNNQFICSFDAKNKANLMEYFNITEE